MSNIIIDLPLTPICTPEVPPLSSSSLPPPAPSFCLSELVLLLPYSYILYLYLRSAWTIHRKGVLRELDSLDIWLCGVSMLRLVLPWGLLVLHTAQVLACMGALALLWQYLMGAVYVRLLVESRRHWLAIMGSLLLVYLVYLWAANHYSKEPATGWHIPVFHPLVLLVLLMTGVALYQFLLISQALGQHILTTNITIQLQNRRSFLFQTLATSWASLLMRKYPQILEPVVGVVLYYVICDLMNLVVVYRCVLDRVVRNNEPEDSESEPSVAGYRRNSGLIVVEMEMKDLKAVK